MLTIKIYGLCGESWENLKKIHADIVTSVCSMPRLDIKDENRIMINVSKDGQISSNAHILVEITGFHTSGDPFDQGKLLAEKVGKILSDKYAVFQVDCSVCGFFDGYKQCGNWQNW